MASSGNFATLNPVDFQGAISSFLSNGNLKANTGANVDAHCGGTLGINADTDTQGYYYEVRIESRSNNQAVGWTRNIYYTGSYGASANQSYVMANGKGAGAGDIFNLNSSSTSFRQSFSDGDIVGVAIKGGKLWFAKNNTYINSGNPAGDSGEAISGATGTLVPVWYVAGGGTNTQYFNFGQDSTFGGAITAGGNADENGFGDFKYAPPTGFLALCSGNLPISDDIDPAQTDDDYPGKQFNVVTWTGNSTNDRAISLDMAPDLVVIKERGAANNWYWYDSNRGASVGLFSNLNQAEATDTSELKSFTSTGFTLGTGGGTNNNNDTYCGWGWRANGGTTTSFSAGGNQLAGTYQANTKSKFSIITYTGSGSANSEVLHGMSATPNFIIFKARNDTHWWGVYHKSGGTVNTGYDSLLYLNSDNALASGQAVNIVPDSTKIVMSGNEQINRSSSYNYVMYAWADVEGMQKFGTYEGNGNADGPFVYTGFRPRMVFCKSTETNEAWVVADTARSTFNVVDKITKWNNSNTEASGSTFAIDIVSNGFKIRTSWSGWNESGKPLIYGAWADVPFKYNNTF